MTTEDILQVALDLAGFEECPGDTAIYVSGENIQKVLFGIDGGVAELMLAKQLGFDCLITHHGMGGDSSRNFGLVLRRHISQMIAAGVPPHVAESAAARLLERNALGAHMANHDHFPSVAKMVGLPCMNVHLPCDEVSRRSIVECVERASAPGATVGDIVEALIRDLPTVTAKGYKPEIRLGSPSNLAGKVAVGIGAGTNGGAEIARAYFDHGVSTLLYMHIGQDALDTLRQGPHGNLIITGHIGSDSIGINRFISALEAKGLKVTRYSGL